MPRDFAFNKDRMNMLAGLVEEDDLEDTRQALTEEYKKEIDEDVKEVEATLSEYSMYTGYKPDNSEKEEELDTEDPEENRPPEEAGLPGWTYYDADPTFAKISTMDTDLQHKKILQWNPPLESELEGMSESDASKAFTSKVGEMIEEHGIIHGALLGPGFGPLMDDANWGMKEQPDPPRNPPGRYSQWAQSQVDEDDLRARFPLEFEPEGYADEDFEAEEAAWAERVSRAPEEDFEDFDDDYYQDVDNEWDEPWEQDEELGMARRLK